MVDETGGVGRTPERLGRGRGEVRGFHLVAVRREALEPFPEGVERAGLRSERECRGTRVLRERADDLLPHVVVRESGGRAVGRDGMQAPLELGSARAVGREPGLRAVHVGIDGRTERGVEGDDEVGVDEPEGDRRARCHAGEAMSEPGEEPYDRRVTTYDRLSALDSSFLHLERPEYPMHVGALSIFEGDPFFDAAGRFRIDDVRAVVDSRLALIPRFRKRLMATPFEQGRPIWIDDERFDIAYHVRLTALPRPGSWEQLLTLAGRVEEIELDRGRPLWELWFVEGLEGGKVALIQKTHHALTDGVSGVDVATVLLDLTPSPPPVVRAEWTPQPAPSPSDLLLASLRHRVTEPAELVRTARRMLRGPRRAVRRATEIASSLTTIINRDAVAPRTSLNAKAGPHRRLAVVRVPLADAKRIRGALGGTVNDVILAAVGDAFGRLLEQRGEKTGGLRLRVMCPVSVRDDDERGALGNKVSALFVSVPVGRLDPAERLSEIAAATRDVKERHQAVGADFLIGLTQYAAPTLLAMGARVAHRQPFFNVVVTNVPGPQIPLYFMGARLVEANPIVPLTRNLTIAVGILSYDGVLHFGLFADRDTWPDLDVLVAGLEDAFAEMVKVASA